MYLITFQVFRSRLIDGDIAFEFECGKNTFYPGQSDGNKTIEEICGISCSKCDEICEEEK